MDKQFQVQELANKWRNIGKVFDTYEEALAFAKDRKTRGWPFQTRIIILRKTSK